MYHIRKRNPESWRDAVIAALRVLARRGREMSQSRCETHDAGASHDSCETQRKMGKEFNEHPDR